MGLKCPVCGAEITEIYINGEPVRDKAWMPRLPEYFGSQAYFWYSENPDLDPILALVEDHREFDECAVVAYIQPNPTIPWGKGVDVKEMKGAWWGPIEKPPRTKILHR